MKEVPLHEAKNGLSALIAEVEAGGESVLITRHGKPAARLSAVSPDDRGEARAALVRTLLAELDEEEAPAVVVDWEELKGDMDADRP